MGTMLRQDSGGLRAELAIVNLPEMSRMVKSAGTAIV